MKLFYRGHSYEANHNSVEGTASEYTGKYRGQDCVFRDVRGHQVQQRKGKRTYRGISY